MRRNYKLLIFAIGVLILTAPSGSAAPGDLDLTFGNGGKVITPGIGGLSDIAIQADGKIVAVGGPWIVRYNPNGSLDNSFGTGGIVIIQLGDNISVLAFSVAIQADGKIVVAAGSHNPATAMGGFAVARYTPHGWLDTTFNSTGKIFNPNQGGYASATAIQTDGKIVVIGGGRDAGGSDYSAVYRYEINGTPDTSFNGTGTIIRQGSTFSAVAIQTDGKIIVAGSESCCGPDTFYARIFRYNADGSPANSFGYADRTFGFLDGVWWDHAHKVAIQPNGGIVTKISGMENTDFCHTCPFSAIGSGNVSLVYEGAHLHAGDLAIQPDGKIVSVNTSYNESDFAVRRYNSNFSLDQTFNGGLVTTDFGSQDQPSAVAVQPDGKIVAAGSSTGFALARYQGGSSTNIRTRFDFDGDGRADVSVFRPSDRVWYLNQSTNGFSATQFGLSTDKITPADYDGDGKTDISVYRDGTWYWLNSSDNNFNARQFGVASDIPVPADYYSGGGRSELAVYRSGTWWILNLFNEEVRSIQFGLATDKPLPADYDGDGRADQAVYRNGEWHLNRSTQGYGVVHCGLATDKPVPSDYDGDGKTDPAVYRDGAWYMMQSLNGWGQIDWGIPSDTPAPADYDGDGKADAAVFRGGTWYLLRSTGGVSIQQFGLTHDKPIPSAYLP